MGCDEVVDVELSGTGLMPLDTETSGNSLTPSAQSGGSEKTAFREDIGSAQNSLCWHLTLDVQPPEVQE